MFRLRRATEFSCNVHVCVQNVYRKFVTSHTNRDRARSTCRKDRRFPYRAYFHPDIHAFCVQRKPEINLGKLPSRGAPPRTPASAFADAEEAVRYRGKSTHIELFLRGSFIESRTTFSSSTTAESAILLSRVSK